jgi:hypothetical protein
MCQREEALYRSDKSMKGVHMVRALAGLLLALFLRKQPIDNSS